MKVKTYSQYLIEEIEIDSLSQNLNEGIFDSLKSIFGKIGSFFADSEKLNKQIDQAGAKAGQKDDKVAAKSIKAGSTIMVKLVDPEDETKKSVMSFTKLSDMPDGSGLFQISGSDSPEFLKSLLIADVAKLNLVGVLAIIPQEGFLKDKPLTMRVYKNVNKEGKPTVTKLVVKAALPAEQVTKEVPE
jgi:hypothetical protein